MSRFLMTTVAFAAIVVAAPAFAQMSSGGGMSSSGSMSCQDMMTKANSQMGSMDDSKKSMAMKQMNMAKADMAQNKENSCKMHMKKVMGMM